MSELYYISVPFKGAYYMCVEGSRQHHILTAANEAHTQGKHDIAQALLAEAMAADGCAFEARHEVLPRPSSIDFQVAWADLVKINPNPGGYQ